MLCLAVVWALNFVSCLHIEWTLKVPCRWHSDIKYLLAHLCLWVEQCIRMWKKMGSGFVHTAVAVVWDTCLIDSYRPCLWAEEALMQCSAPQAVSAITAVNSVRLLSSLGIECWLVKILDNKILSITTNSGSAPVIHCVISLMRQVVPLLFVVACRAVLGYTQVYAEWSPVNF